MSKNNSDFEKFYYAKGLVEFISLFIIIFSMDKGIIFLVFSIILSIFLSSIPNFIFKFETAKEYWNANVRAILAYLLISFLAFILLSTFGTEYDAFGLFIIVLVFGIIYIPIFLIVSYIVDIIFFKTRNK